MDIKECFSVNRMSLELSPPTVTAKSWVLYEMRQGKCLLGKRSYKRREIASLTKMMNLITVLELLEAFGVNPGKVRARASEDACAMTGTTA
ncbi:unnamed protein product [Sphagnum balticum]